MGKKQRGTKVMNNGARRGRLAGAWSLLAVATAICVSVGACALLLPDRAPALLGSAGETTRSGAEDERDAQHLEIVGGERVESDAVGQRRAAGFGDLDLRGSYAGLCHFLAL